MEPAEQQNTELRTKQLQNYYRLHSAIYDWTRWIFLFGREKILDLVPELPPNPRILEVGCGTGKNLAYMEYLFPDGHLYGIDLSEDMIRQARKKFTQKQPVELIHGAYGSDDFEFKPFNLILLSYSLSMLGPHAEDILQQVHYDLAAGGYIAVVDFNETPFRWFRKWMKVNHVDLDGHLPELLNKYFSQLKFTEHTAYLGFWSYILFLGERK